MNYLILLFMVLVAFLAYKHLLKPPRPSLPPPPPALSRPPAPALGDEQVRRVIESTRDINPQVRWEAARLLVQMRVPQTRELIPEMLIRDPDPGVRKQILNLIAGRPGARGEISRLLLGSLKDESPEVRLEAIGALARIGDPSVTVELSEALNDPSDVVRLAAMNAINALQSKAREMNP